ncbi:hypothetical protein HZA38_01120 [Candidatus Peregrinibacteria bacterium]|nr:hypothetical protein [Candidatus Peregrinibacteria bacterium]
MNQKKFFISLCLFLVIFIVPSFRNVYHWFPFPELFAFLYLISGGVVFYVLFRNVVITFIEKVPSKIIFLCGIVYLLIMSAFTFQVLDWSNSLKSFRRDSTADDAMILSAQSFFDGAGMYNATLYDGAPISPGPGWILLNSPLSLSGLYFLITPIWLGIFLWMIWKKSHHHFPVVFVLITLSMSTIFWTLTGVGHDLVSISFAIGIFFLMTKNITKETRILTLLFIAIFVGIISTSRILFLILPCIFALIIPFTKRAFLFFVTSLITALLFHFIFFELSSNYDPLHLFSRGERSVGYDLMALGGILEIGIGALSLYLYTHPKIQFAYKNILPLLLLFLPLFLISFGELRNVGFDFAKWEGANYLIPVWGMYLVTILGEMNVAKTGSPVSRNRSLFMSLMK